MLNVIALYYFNQSVRMIVMLVCEHNHINVAIPEGQRLAQRQACRLGVRSAVDEKVMVGGAFYQDGIPLSHVDEADLELACLRCGEDDGPYHCGD